IPNPRFQYVPGYPINQMAYQTALFGRAIRQVPPWVYGYNPYPSPIINNGQVFPQYGGGYPGLPYAATLNAVSPGYGSLYAGGGGGHGGGYGGPGSGGAGGYSSTPSSGGYASPDPFGGGLTGAANAINAQGKFEIDFQKARLLNQEVERSKIDPRRKIYDEWL